jgi:hypothetical protein
MLDARRKTFTEGNSERFREQEKKTKVRFCASKTSPSLPSFPSVDFVFPP